MYARAIIEAAYKLSAIQDDHFKRFKEIERLRYMPYAEYLETGHWKMTRKVAFARAKGRCQVCNVKDVELHVHHRTYERRGDERPQDLIVLCCDCHTIFHENGKLASPED